jgi:hypothetical protein
MHILVLLWRYNLKWEQHCWELLAITMISNATTTTIAYVWELCNCFSLKDSILGAMLFSIKILLTDLKYATDHTHALICWKTYMLTLKKAKAINYTICATFWVAVPWTRTQLGQDVDNFNSHSTWGERTWSVQSSKAACLSLQRLLSLYLSVSMFATHESWWSLVKLCHRKWVLVYSW